MEVMVVDTVADMDVNTTFLLKYKGDSFECSFSWI
jgi:hypothetical protein